MFHVVVRVCDRLERRSVYQYSIIDPRFRKSIGFSIPGDFDFSLSSTSLSHESDASSMEPQHREVKELLGKVTLHREDGYSEDEPGICTEASRTLPEPRSCRLASRKSRNSPAASDEIVSLRNVDAFRIETSVRSPGASAAVSSQKAIHG